MELVVVVSPKRREGQGPEARGRRHRTRTRRRIPRPPRRFQRGPPALPSNPSKGSNNIAFSPENLKIRVNSREIHAFIQTATYPPFTKGTRVLELPEIL